MDKELISVCDVLECQYRGDDTECMIFADPITCGVISGDYSRSEWEAHIEYRYKMMMKNADKLRSREVAP